jgi:hypothetical protein
MTTRRETVLALTLLTVTLSCRDTPEEVHLQFRPASGKEQAVRVAIKRMFSQKADGREEKTVSTGVYTFGLNPVQTDADGTVHIRAAIRAIRIKPDEGSNPILAYDSDDASGAPRAFGPQFSAFIGRGFIIKVSRQGELAEAQLDGLFRAAAVALVERFDQALQDKYASEAQEMIEKSDAYCASREKRILEAMKGLEFTPLPRSQVECMLRDLLSPLPAGPVSCGDSWNASAVAYLHVPVEIATLHTLKTTQEGICTIDVRGQRSPEDKSIVAQVGPAGLNIKAEGTYQATLQVEQKTGRLLSKQAKTSLTGTARITEGNRQPHTVPFTMEETTTVETIE